jgi:hypothetical protein
VLHEEVALQEPQLDELPNFPENRDISLSTFDDLQEGQNIVIFSAGVLYRTSKVF